MAQPNYYVYCFVPGCKNTSTSNPDKLFFNVPQGERRKKWCAAVGRDFTNISLTSERRCCQDHFKLEEDVENWLSYRILRDCNHPDLPKLRLKKTVVPHVFPSLRNGSQSVKNKEIVSGMKLKEQENLQPDISTLCSVEIGNMSENSCDDFPCQSPENIKIKQEEFLFIETNSCRTEENSNIKFEDEDSPFQEASWIRSKHVQVVVPTKSSQTCPVKIKKRRMEDKRGGHSDFINAVIQSSGSSYEFESLSSLSAHDETDFTMLKIQYVSINIYLMEKSPRRHLGLDAEKLGLIKVLQDYTGCSKKDILIALRKIRKNESLDDLKEVFGVAESNIFTLIRQTVPLISSYLSKFIYWPEPKAIKNNLPIAFRINYSSVQCIIDCFEVVTMRPSSSVIQLLMQSDSKSHNTVKFLIAITPDGFISFVSKSFEGKASDIDMLKNSGFLDELKPGMVVMVNGGFKGVEKLLLERECSLIRPPNVPTKSKMTKSEDRQSKIAANLRITLECVTKRIREYVLFSYPAFHYNMLDLIDQCIIIVCALANTQGPIFM